MSFKELGSKKQEACTAALRTDFEVRRLLGLPEACSPWRVVGDLSELSVPVAADSARRVRPVADVSPASLATYSARNAIIGSTRLALRAGTQQARRAMLNKSKATHVKVTGSEALTP